MKLNQNNKFYKLTLILISWIINLMYNKNNISKKIKKIILIILLLPSTAYSTKTIPSIEIEYSPMLDSVCALFKGYEIKDEWKTELIKKQVALNSIWNEYGEERLLTTTSILGKPFDRKTVTVHLTLCNTPSRSFPVIVNMRYTLSSFIDKPVSIHVKTGTLFHEVLHPYVDKNLPEKSHLLDLFNNENPRVIKHLHLLALLKAVYLNLDLNNQLTSIIKTDSQLPNGYYKKAWSIVNSKPSYYLEFISELQNKKI